MTNSKTTNGTDGQPTDQVQAQAMAAGAKLFTATAWAVLWGMVLLFATCTSHGQEALQGDGLPAPVYAYHGTVVDVYDGDTMTVVLDLGFGFSYRARLRIEGIDTPELRGEERAAGMVVRDHVRLLLLDKPVVVTSHKKDKYGRWLAYVLFSLEGQPTDLGSYLLSTERAAVYGE